MAGVERSEGTATTTATDPETATFDYDVAIVSGGPTGHSADTFTGRYGLDTAAFDHGRSSLQHCVYLENYLGFPGGIDVETFYGLIHDHVEAISCGLIPTLVEAVKSADGDETETTDTAGPDFEVTTQDDETVTARWVVTAVRYGGDFLEPLDDDETFVAYECDSETRTKFDCDYAGTEDRIAIDGPYVAAPVSEVNVQAVMSAEQGAHVGRSIVISHRLERGYPEALAHHQDWIRLESELVDEETAHDGWRERFDSRVPGDCDLAEERLRELREADVECRRETYISEEAVEVRVECGCERLTDHLGAATDPAPDLE